MQLSDCSVKEAALLIALISITAAADPAPIPSVAWKIGNLSRYLGLIAELRTTYFHIPGRRLARRHRSCQNFGRGSVPTRTIRASERFGYSK